MELNYKSFTLVHLLKFRKELGFSILFNLSTSLNILLPCDFINKNLCKKMVENVNKNFFHIIYLLGQISESGALFKLKLSQIFIGRAFNSFGGIHKQAYIDIFKPCF